LAGFKRDFRFTGQKHIYTAGKKGVAQNVTTRKPKTKGQTSMKQTSIKQILCGTSPIRMKQKLSKAAMALLFTSCLALLPKAQAVNPKPGGGYPGATRPRARRRF